jgi:hypothetical protein
MPEVFTLRPETGTVNPAESQVSLRAGCRSKDLGDVRGTVGFAIDLVTELGEPVGFELVLDAEVSDDEVRTHEVTFHSESLAKAVAGSGAISLMLATIGPACEAMVSSMEASGEHLKAFLLDAAASVFVENVMKEMHRQVSARMSGFDCTVRFSPGFGDFSLENQVTIVRLLGGKNTGVKAMEGSCTLVPVKSTTGVVGWIQRPD